MVWLAIGNILLETSFTGFPERLTGTATLTVNVDDINDNAPKLVNPVATIEENLPLGSVVRPREVKGYDPDSPENGPPFTMRAAGLSVDSKDFEFTFHAGTKAHLDMPS